jgi:hypothetical protein
MSRPNPITLSVRNFSTVVQDLAAPFRVLMDQANNDLHLHWHDAAFVETIAEVRQEDRWPVPQDGMWRATIYDYPYQVMNDDDLSYIPVSALAAIGYHFPDNGFPHLVVFAANGQEAGVPWTMTLSHELLESLVDPSTTDTWPCPGEPREAGWPPVIDEYEKEICDPVQAQAYPLGDRESGKTFWVSNFVTPEWFGPVSAPLERVITPRWFDGATKTLDRKDQIRYDFAGQLVSARQLALGGMRTLKLDGRDKTELLTRLGSMVISGE